MNENNSRKKKKLTTRELEVYALLKEGYSHKVIAPILGISETTSRTHSKNMHFKTDTHNLAELTKWIDNNH